ncbi:NADase-type glycan-binding domain-containing protein [Neolewinella antarctica]|uniref:NAD glycohydrolase translocation F5/8 type C domain-containing protein n=1 Tax=Neolewinella antarctica TaxID=442734 RepID=A0ABX0XDD1_9BACT|nr:hypothetical protein [Neolewinella antarctica]NJC27310.1 hypothetical protein [Neolewinella antarctica]
MQHFLYGLLSILLFGIPELTPILGELIDKSAAGAAQFDKEIAPCVAVMNKLSVENFKYEDLTLPEMATLDKYEDMFYKGYWSILPPGCSWYCGDGPKFLSASSHLVASGNIDYRATNAHDDSYETAWVEGAPGPGIGEKLSYHFTATSPRVTEVIIINGYVKSAEAWQDNSRVKQLKLYVDNQPYALLNLEDSRREQSFTVEPIGTGDREDWAAMENLPDWTLTFEIMSVYPGEKYPDDTAITELYFDGLDVH